jgi:hypothetical protein
MLLLLCCSSDIWSKEKVIERPPFIAWSSSSLEIDKVVLGDTETVLYIKAIFRPRNWIKIASTSFLVDDNGKQYILRSTEGITVDEEFYMPDSVETEFK